MATLAGNLRNRRFLRVPNLRALPWRRILAVFAVFVALNVFVAPFRRVVSLVVGDVVLFVATPFAPKTADFSKLPGATKLVAADGSVIGDLGVDGLRRTEPVVLAAVPDRVKNAVLAAEDKDFYHHGGVDPRGITRAFFHTLQGETQGGSTITQQLAKLNYTAGERTLFRKVRETLYASKLERRYTKDELLERYLNQVYFGDGAYGMASAARVFFGTTVDQLTASQAAVLAGKIRAPEYLDPTTALRDVTRRRNQVLVNMERQDWLTKAEYNAAVAEPIAVVPRVPVGHGPASHFISYLEREAKTINALGGDPDTRASQLFTGNYVIQTTLDPKINEATRESVQKRLGETGDPTTAAATVVPGDGAIRSLFGGLDFATTQFDMSSMGGRQAGSSFKPFVYMAMLRAGIDPRSTVNGSSGRVIDCYGDKPVDNYAGENAGSTVDIDEALVHSVNVAFVELGCEVGVREVVKTARDDGIPEDATSAQGAVFLGGLDGKGVNALDMASAFATFGSGGIYAQPYSIARITDRDGKVIFEHSRQTKRVFSVDQVGVINRPLQGVVQEGTGVAAKIGRPVAGKTGTTQNNVDAWFIGYTPDLATSVWVGYAQPKPMSRVHGRAVTGGSFPAQIFSDIMRAGHKGIKVHSLPTVDPDHLDLRRLSRSHSDGPAEETTTTLLEVPVEVPTSVDLGDDSDTTTTTDRTTRTTRPPRTTTTQPEPTPTTAPPAKKTTAESTPTTAAA